MLALRVLPLVFVGFSCVFSGFFPMQAKDTLSRLSGVCKWFPARVC